MCVLKIIKKVTQKQQFKTLNLPAFKIAAILTIKLDFVQLTVECVLFVIIKWWGNLDKYMNSKALYGVRVSLAYAWS